MDLSIALEKCPFKQIKLEKKKTTLVFLKMYFICLNDFSFGLRLFSNNLTNDLLPSIIFCAEC